MKPIRRKLKPKPKLKPKHEQLNPADRLSALPDRILHHIISFLDFKEACRTCMLSKRWTHISDTNPVMDLSHDDSLYWSDRIPKFDSFLKYTESRLKRYSKHKLHINKLTLGFPIRRETFRNTNIPLENKAEEWVKIAVRNQVAELVLIGPKNYVLSDILFTATSLRSLDCNCVEIYDYKGIVLFPSLESLFFDEVYVDDPMLNRIISSCLLLKHLRIFGCHYKSTAIPCSSKLETLDLSNNFSRDERIVTIETSSLTSFQYNGYVHSGGAHGERWPVVSKDGFLRNLRILKIGFVSITDDILGKLLSELILLKILKLCNCSLLKTIKISSVMLKEFRLEHCSDLLDVSIDAPCLETFKYKGDFKPSVCINSQVGCDISFHIPPCDFSTGRFSKMKELLKGLRSCHVLKISLLDHPADKYESDDIDLDEEELADGHLGLPCDIRELKLTLSSWILSNSYLSTFLDCVFWTCHPHIFSLRVNLKAPNVSIEPLVRKLRDMANCWKHPLKRVEVEGANCSNLLKTRKLDVQLRLHWLSGCGVVAGGNSVVLLGTKKPRVGCGGGEGVEYQRKNKVEYH
ncbi:hypothetical protein KSS87_022419, partial [Heliosperma pusillum]